MMKKQITLTHQEVDFSYLMSAILSTIRIDMVLLGILIIALLAVPTAIILGLTGVLV